MDDHPLESLDHAWLRSNMGVVNQEPALFPISIEDNIRLGKEDATSEEIIRACQIANIHEFIMSKLHKVCPQLFYIICRVLIYLFDKNI